MSAPPPPPPKKGMPLGSKGLPGKSLVPTKAPPPPGAKVPGGTPQTSPRPAGPPGAKLPAGKAPMPGGKVPVPGTAKPGMLGKAPGPPGVPGKAPGPPGQPKALPGKAPGPPGGIAKSPGPGPLHSPGKSPASPSGNKLPMPGKTMPPGAKMPGPGVGAPLGKMPMPAGGTVPLKAPPPGGTKAPLPPPGKTPLQMPPGKGGAPPTGKLPMKAPPPGGKLPMKLPPGGKLPMKSPTPTPAAEDQPLDSARSESSMEGTREPPSDTPIPTPRDMPKPNTTDAPTPFSTPMQTPREGGSEESKPPLPVDSAADAANKVGTAGVKPTTPDPANINIRRPDDKNITALVGNQQPSPNVLAGGSGGGAAPPGSAEWPVHALSPETSAIPPQPTNEEYILKIQQLERKLFTAEKQVSQLASECGRLRETLYDREGVKVVQHIAELEREDQRNRLALQKEKDAVLFHQSQHMSTMDELVQLRQHVNAGGDYQKLLGENERLNLQIGSMVRANTELSLRLADVNEINAMSNVVVDPIQTPVSDQGGKPVYVRVRRGALCTHCREMVDRWESMLIRRTHERFGGPEGVTSSAMLMQAGSPQRSGEYLGQGGMQMTPTRSVMNPYPQLTSPSPHITHYRDPAMSEGHLGNSPSSGEGARGWRPLQLPNGNVVYHNIITNKSQWEKPPELTR